MHVINCHDGNAVLVCEADKLRLIDENRAAGFDGEDTGAGGDERFDRTDPDRGDIETHVLLRLGDFDDGERALTATLWPMSRRPISLASCQPNSISLRSAAVGVRRVSCPARARSCGAKSVAGAIVIPARANSWTTAESSASSLRFCRWAMK